MVDLAARERDKYERMAAFEQYKKSFGLNFVEDVFAALKPAAGDTLWDFGCGTGLCVKWFRERGILANGIDITPARLIDEAKNGFIESPLWGLDGIPRATWGFCSDVMEHIPPEKVDDVLGGIFNKTQRGVYFTISTVSDNCGKLIGEQLHLTVQPFEWWEAKLREWWENVTFRGDYGSGGVFLCINSA